MAREEPPIRTEVSDIQRLAKAWLFPEDGVSELHLSPTRTVERDPPEEVAAL
jgi:hypothetical protein